MAARFAPSPVVAAAGRHWGERSSFFRADGLARRLFLPVQIALSLVLITVACLLMSTLNHLRKDDRGFHTDGVFLAQLDLAKLKLNADQLVDLNRHIVGRLEQMPGVLSAAGAENTPLNGAIESNGFAPVGQGGAVEKQAEIDDNEVTAHYFSSLSTLLLQGRDFTNSDVDSHSCIVNRAAAEQLFGAKPVVGQSLRRFRTMENGDTQTRDCQIVGVVENAKYDTLRENPPATIYSHFSDETHHMVGLTLVIRARSMEEAADAYANTMRELGRGTPQSELTPFSRQVEESIARERLLSLLSGFFAALALILSAIGIYGVMNWSVAQRSGEIGIRMALGASRSSIVSGVVRQVLWMSVTGIVAGGLFAAIAARSLKSLLYGVDPASPVVFALAVALLLATVLVSAFFPARRAASVDPLKALRSE
jgi:predicted permease